MPRAPAGPQLGDTHDAERVLANLDELSDEQVGALLTEMLAETGGPLTPAERNRADKALGR